METPPWPRSVDDDPDWDFIKLRIDRPSLDLAKLFTWAFHQHRHALAKLGALGGKEYLLNTPVPGTMCTADMVAQLLDLGADVHLVLCHPRPDDDVFYEDPDVEFTAPAMSKFLDAFCVPVLMAACGDNIDIIKVFARHGARLNKVIETVISYEQNPRTLANPFAVWRDVDHFMAVLDLVEPGNSVIHNWLGEGVVLALERGSENDLDVAGKLLAVGATPRKKCGRPLLKQDIIDAAVRRSIIPATLGKHKPELIAAAYQGGLHASIEALNRNPDIEIRGPFGMTALMISAGASSNSLCQLLLDRGANPNTFDVFGMSPLMDAVYYGHEEVVKSLLRSGANVHYRIKGEPLLDFVGSPASAYIAQASWLVQRNFAARMCHANRWNATHLAAHRGFTGILAILCQHGADTEIEDDGGSTSSDLALKNGHPTTADFLRKLRGQSSGGSDMDLRDRCIESPMPSSNTRRSQELLKDIERAIIPEHVHTDDDGCDMQSAQEDAALCELCFAALCGVNFRILSDKNPHCRFCRMLPERGPGSARPYMIWAPEFSKMISLKDPSSDENSETHYIVRKLPSTWTTLLEQVNSLQDANTGSPAAMLMARGWHANCIRDHTRCKPRSHSDYFPTRVLNIKHAKRWDRVKLTNDSSLRGTPYVALSHRWGTETLPTTTCDNLVAREKGFDTSELSPTMRDAVTIAQNLQYDYVWIDALCIVQDSEADWLYEASQMSNVFSNAAITIAVADSTQHSQGIFRARQTTFDRPFRIPYFQDRPYRERTHFDGEGEYFLFPRTPEVRSKGPLDSRGWILQEQLLSPSILYFDQGEIFWDCISATASESSPISASLLNEADPDEVWALKYIRRIIAGSGDNDTRAIKISDAWLEIIKNYSNRQLTKASDRLIALQGIIEPLKQTLKEDPVAGMWRTLLWRQLTWWTERPSTPTQSEFTAPSWSWLSVPSRVYYHNSLLGETPENDTVVHKYTDLQAFSFMADTTEGTTLEGTAGVAGTMSVSAKFFTYRLTPMDLKKPAYKRWYAAKLKLNAGRWMLDRRIEVPADVHCLIIAEDEVAKSLVLLCIVPDAEHDGMWKRIGLCHWEGLVWQIPSFIGTTPETGTFTLV